MILNTGVWSFEIGTIFYNFSFHSEWGRWLSDGQGPARRQEEGTRPWQVQVSLPGWLFELTLVGGTLNCVFVGRHWGSRINRQVQVGSIVEVLSQQLGQLLLILLSDLLLCKTNCLAQSFTGKLCHLQHSREIIHLIKFSFSTGIGMARPQRYWRYMARCSYYLWFKPR